MTDTTMTLVELPEEIHIANVSAVRDDLDQHLNGSLTQVDIAAASVNRVDTAGLQLLRAFSGAAEEAGATVRWLDPSAQLLEAFANLGWSVTVGSAGDAAAEPEAGANLYEKIGGRAAVEAVVADFYTRVLADPTISHYFADKDMEELRRHQTAFVAMAIGGPKEYSGRKMTDAHAGQNITRAAFSAVAGHLMDALTTAGVDAEDVATIISVVASLENDVVDA